MIGRDGPTRTTTLLTIHDKFLAGDWGTSNLRLFLCDAAGKVLDSAAGPGAAESSGRFSAVFNGLTAAWHARHGALPAILCGMVGSNFGWRQAPYVSCPASPEQIGAGCVSPDDAAADNGAIHIVPGLRCQNRFRAPDFMRGEETQILGALQLDAGLLRGRQLLCLPGTHSKWVLLEDGVVMAFNTAPTGELFAILKANSVLVSRPASSQGIGEFTGKGDEQGAANDAAFALGLQQANAFPQAQLLHRLFECRARLLAGELEPAATASFLSGLLIASDVSGALPMLGQAGAGAAVQLIGAPALTALYAQALAALKRAVRQLDGASASLAGLTRIFQQLQPGSERRAAH